MDPSSLFAPGGIVQGLSNLGNSIGDSFKSYALIRKERDDADMARTKMLFDAQDKIKDRELEQKRLDAMIKFQQGQLANDSRRTDIEQGRETREAGASAVINDLNRQKLEAERANQPLEVARLQSQIDLLHAQTAQATKQTEIAGKGMEEQVKTRREATAARLQGQLAAINQKYVGMRLKVEEQIAKEIRTAQLMNPGASAFTVAAQVKNRYRPQLDAIEQARVAEAAPVHTDAKQESLSLFDEGPSPSLITPTAGLWAGPEPIAPVAPSPTPTMDSAKFTYPSGVQPNTPEAADARRAYESERVIRNFNPFIRPDSQ